MPLVRADSEITLRDGWAVQSSAKVNASGEVVSTAGFDASSWYKTSAPNTVFAVLVENGVYKDPYFGMNLRSVPGVSYPIGGQFANLEMPEDSPYAVPWWYLQRIRSSRAIQWKNGLDGVSRNQLPR